ncbi:hypothetical protein V502_04791 [Pseudogymnoascus sp. VKM F-4520 (FW-2644)]|nr:hypothetical protein V502_04791 [Pseudogymnoascus sp. VKM F-4520 (FW-2644)]
MNRLPQEIIDCIVFFLPGGPDAERVHYPEIQPTRAQYATISSKFHAAIERSTFNSLRIKSDELETFAQYLKPCRQGFLRILVYNILLPPINTAVSERFERPSETEAVSKLFSHYVKDLFDTLHRLDSLSGICLCFGDVSHPYRRNDNETLVFEDDDGLGISRHMRSRINLLDPEALPQLKCISNLELVGWQRTPAPSIMIDLAARMPGLVKLFLDTASYEVRYPGLLREDRHSLATMLKLRSEETKTASEAILDMSMDGGAVNQMVPMPNLTYPMGYDLLGSSRLHSVFIRDGANNLCDPSRNPAEDPDDLPQPFTDNPTDGADPFDREEEDNWNCQRIIFRPLVEGWAKALQCMPSLRHARLSFGIVTPVGGDEEDQSMEDWEIIYESPDFHNPTWKTLGDGERSSRRLIFHGTGGWRPNNDTMDLLQRIGEDSYSGTKLVVLDINDFDEIIREWFKAYAFTQGFVVVIDNTAPNGVYPQQE